MRRSNGLLVAGMLVTGWVTAPAAPPASAVSGSPTVVVIVLENEPYTGIVGRATAPYLNSLIDQGLLFTNYHAQIRGSAPNYRAMTSGTTRSQSPPPENVFRSFDQASRSWIEFDESMTANCGGPNHQKVPGSSEALYSNAHDPAYMFRANESCTGHDVPLTSDEQLSALPGFTYIVPNQCDNMHTYAKTAPCPSYFGPVTGSSAVRIGDNWLAHVVPVLLSDPDATVIITFDEGADSSAQHIYTVELGAGVTPGTVDARLYDHYGLLAGLYQAFGLGPAPNGAKNATPLPIAPDVVPDHDLTVDVEGAGRVTSTPSGIDCGTGQSGTCSASFAHGTSVTLTETPEAGSGFAGWSGACTGTGSCAVSMSVARSATATFTPLLTLTVDPPTNGSVTSDVGGIDCAGTCSHDFVSGASVALTAHPDPGYRFDSWGGDCGGTSTSTCTLTMDRAKSASVTFLAVPQHTLTAATDGTGEGTVTSDVGEIACPPTCSADFIEGEVVALTAHAGATSAFTGWSGACTGVSLTCFVTIDRPQWVTGTFDAASSELTLDDTDRSITFNGWRGVVEPVANGGGYRASGIKGDKAVWTSPKATSVTWVAFTGPTGGKASVRVDGKSKGTVDLYAARPGKLSKTYGGLRRKAHTVVLKVTGSKNRASSGTDISVDAFKARATTFSESDPSITYDTWVGLSARGALGRSYRGAPDGGATVTVMFTGTSIDWISSMGPSSGKASVKIDGARMGTVDLYSPTQIWQSNITFGGLSAGAHTLVIQVLGRKNAASHGTKVSFDGLTIHGP
jgi:hypothetical protein